MSFIYKEEDPDHRSRVILKGEGDDFTLILQRRFEPAPEELCFEIKMNDVRLVGNRNEFLLMIKALLALELYDFANKLAPALDIEEHFEYYLRDVYPKLKRKPDMRYIEQDKELFREFYSSIESEEEFAKRRQIAVTTFRSKRERYNLPHKSALVRVSKKAIRALEFGKKNYICKHKDCLPCRLIERRFRGK